MVDLKLGFEPCITPEALQGIKDYCAARNYKCKTCRYSINKVNPEASKYVECIFGNCPCSWELREE